MNEYITLKDIEEINGFNLTDEIKLLMDLSHLDEFKEIMTNNFTNFSLRGYSISYEHFINQIFSKTINNNLGNIILIYLYCSEFILNALTLIFHHYRVYGFIESFNSSYSLYIDRINKVLSTINYESYENQEGDFEIRKINVAAEKLSEHLPKEVALDVLMFNKFNLSTMEKQKIVEELYKYYEEIRFNTRKPLSDTIGSLFNNGIRHTRNIKITSKALKAFIDNHEDRDYLIQKLYDLMLEAFYNSINKEFTNEIDNVLNTEREENKK